MSTTVLNSAAQSDGKPKKVKYKPPFPLTTFRDNALLFVENMLKIRAYRYIFGAIIGYFAAAGVYWLLTQTNHPIHAWWHATFVIDAVRHNHRAQFEGLMGGALGVLVAWIHDKAKYQKGLNRFERFLVHRLHLSMPNDGKDLSLGQLLISPILLFVGGGIGIWLIGLVANHFGAGPDGTVKAASVFSVHNSGGVWGTIVSHAETTANALIEDWPLRLQGFVGSLLGLFLIKGVIDDLHGFIAEWDAGTRTRPLGKLALRVLPDKYAKWYAYRRQYGNKAIRLLPPGYAARYRTACGDITVALQRRPRAITLLMKVGVVSIVLLAILGFAAINFNLPHVK